MIALSRWCIVHYRRVVAGWLVLAVALTVLASAAGRQYTSNFSLPGTQSQRVIDLLHAHFPAQAGDVDQIVFHSAPTSIDAAPVRRAIEPLLAKVRRMPHVETVLSPYSAAGRQAVSRDGHTAFATVTYDKRANLLPDATGKPVLRAVAQVTRPGLSVAAGGQVMEQAEGFSVGPATGVGVIAAFVILLLTFGSLIAAGLPLLTAGLGLVSGVGLIGLATHVTDMSNVAPELALMIGLGVGIDYALFIVTRFRESFARLGDVHASVLEAMDTSGRAILLAGSTVIIALLGMFATGVAFMYGLSIASILAVLLTLGASLTVLPALLGRYGHRLAAGGWGARRRAARGTEPQESLWRRWSVTVQSRPWPLAVVSVLVMLVCIVPMLSMRLQSSDAGNDPSGVSTRRAFDLLAAGFGPGFNGPLLIAAELPRGHDASATNAGLTEIRSAVAHAGDVDAVTQPRIAPSGSVAVFSAYPASAPQASATTALVHRLRERVLPGLRARTGIRALVGGFTAGSIDFSGVLSRKLLLFIAIVVVLSALLLLVIFRSLVIPIQAGIMNLLSIGGALGATVAVFQDGWLSGVLGVQKGPIEPWIPVLMFAVVFGLSMDYEVFLVSRVREEWVRGTTASRATADGIAFTGRVISAAAAIMICVFLSFLLGDERPLKEFGFGLGAAIFLDAIVVRCVMLPAVLELLGPLTWRLPDALDRRLPHINIEGSAATAAAVAQRRSGRPSTGAARAEAPAPESIGGVP